VRLEMESREVAFGEFPLTCSGSGPVERRSGRSRKKDKRRSLANSEVGKGSWEVEMRDGESFDCGLLVYQSTKTT